jgi:hypothetical protein
MQGNAAAGGLLVVIARKYGRLFETHAVTGKGDRFVTGVRRVPDTIAYGVSAASTRMAGAPWTALITGGLYVQAYVSPIILQPKSVAT